MKNVLVVDCENCYGKDTREILKNYKAWTIILVFGKFQEVDYSLITGNMQIERSSLTSKNSADFVVVSIAASMLQSKEVEKLCIVSNDKGFDSAVNYLRKNGHNINRYNTEILKEKCPLRDTLKLKPKLDEYTCLEKRYLNLTKRSQKENDKISEKNCNYGDKLEYEAKLIADILKSKCKSGMMLGNVLAKLYCENASLNIERALGTLIKLRVINATYNQHNQETQINWKNKNINTFINDFLKA